MYYRTRTYLAGDWDGDYDLINQIQERNKSDNWALDFSDAHDLMQARDGSLPCTIKNSLSQRLDASKTFVLIVGKHTNDVTKGSCQYCSNYPSRCSHNGYFDFRSFVKYECEKAAREYKAGNMRIVVIYNSQYIYKDRCPESLRFIGKHIPGLGTNAYGSSVLNYLEIKKAIMNL